MGAGIIMDNRDDGIVEESLQVKTQHDAFLCDLLA
jgi:hypothetical protein